MVAQIRGSSGGDEKWLNSGYILKEGPIGFGPIGWGKSSKKKREVKMDCNIIDLTNGEDWVVII